MLVDIKRIVQENPSKNSSYLANGLPDLRVFQHFQWKLHGIQFVFKYFLSLWWIILFSVHRQSWYKKNSAIIEWNVDLWEEITDKLIGRLALSCFSNVFFTYPFLLRRVFSFVSVFSLSKPDVPVSVEPSNPLDNAVERDTFQCHSLSCGWALTKFDWQLVLHEGYKVDRFLPFSFYPPPFYCLPLGPPPSRSVLRIHFLRLNRKFPWFLSSVLAYYWRSTEFERLSTNRFGFLTEFYRDWLGFRMQNAVVGKVEVEETTGQGVRDEPPPPPGHATGCRYKLDRKKGRFN